MTLTFAEKIDQPQRLNQSELIGLDRNFDLTRGKADPQVYSNGTLFHMVSGTANIEKPQRDQLLFL